MPEAREQTGLSWESVPVGRVDPGDLWWESFSIFRTKVLESGRMTEAELSSPDWDLLDKLGLVSKGQLNRAGYIESWGRGIDKIREACEANGNPMVEFELDDSGVMARLDAPDWWGRGESTAAGNAESSDFKSDSKSDDKSDLEKAVIELLSRNPRITLPELAKEVGVARSTVALRVSALQRDGVIRRVGSRKSGHWEVIGRNASGQV